MSNNILKTVLENAVKNNTLDVVSEKLGISVLSARYLRDGGSANIDSDKLLNFICEYMTNPKILICKDL